MSKARDIADSLGSFNPTSINVTGGDVSFEDTSGNPDFFWDASAESLGIGTSSPAREIHSHQSSGGSTNYALFTNTTTGSTSGDGIIVGLNATSDGYLWNYEAGNLVFGTSSTERMRIDASGNAGIGVVPDTWASNYKALQLGGAFNAISGPNLNHLGNAYWDASGQFKYTTTGTASRYYQAGDQHIWYNAASGSADAGVSFSERMRIDASGNVLVGKASTGSTVAGIVLGNNDKITATRSSGPSAAFVRTGSDGSFVDLQKDGSTVGNIGVNAGNNIVIGSSQSGHAGLQFGSNVLTPFSVGTYSDADNTYDLGSPSYRWDDIYATNGTIQTSDRNEKQDIEALSDAEQRVAVACKGLLRKFRWKDKVAEKGDDARIHFGIIAQDLQDAFAAEGLDAGRYAMFISTTWWETQTEVPAVEAVEAVYEDIVIPAVLDEEGNEVEPERTEQQLVTEAVEAKEAYTRTDTYETLEEAPEGATERTRLGVRYPELLAFIIAAI